MLEVGPRCGNPRGAKFADFGSFGIGPQTSDVSYQRLLDPT